MSHEIFDTYPDLEKVFVTSDNTPFYQETDAKNYAKSLKDKSVETVFNPKNLEVVINELSDEDKEIVQFEPTDEKALLVQSLLDFDPEKTEYQDAVKLFNALGLDAENAKKDTIYPLLAQAKAKAQEGAELEKEN